MSDTAENASTTRSRLSLGKHINKHFNTVYSDEEKNTDGSEKEITYGEYVEKINKRALEEQKKIIQARMRGELKRGDGDDNWTIKKADWNIVRAKQ